MDIRNKVFISYAHEGNHVASDLKKHLTTRLRSEVRPRKFPAGYLAG
jgi:hypothetical protein